MISYILPTHDRPDRLAKSLTRIGRLCALEHGPLGGAEVVIVDNASHAPPTLPKRLANGLPVRSFRMASNQGAAARNFAAEQAQGDWLIMLDDDSYPLDTDFITVLDEAPPDVAAIGADIRLPDQRREAGGLPEVFVGCGDALLAAATLTRVCGGSLTLAALLGAVAGPLSPSSLGTWSSALLIFARESAGSARPS